MILSNRGMDVSGTSQAVWTVMDKAIKVMTGRRGVFVGQTGLCCIPDPCAKTGRHWNWR